MVEDPGKVFRMFDDQAGTGSSSRSCVGTVFSLFLRIFSSFFCLRSNSFFLFSKE